MTSIAAAPRISPALVRRLRQEAEQARDHAYCPYSSFPVGAAVLARDGRTFSGCNVENASYGLTSCAERNAIFAAVAAGVREVRAVIIATRAGRPTPPCGACRQVLHEFGSRAEVLSFPPTGRGKRWTAAELLPASFGGPDLGRRRGG